MKKIVIVIVVLMVLIAGCEEQTNEPPKVLSEVDKVRNSMYGPSGYQVLIIDSCEYIVGWGGGGYGGPILTHKGNCKNKHHKDNQ